jgi:hypothetical protein
VRALGGRLLAWLRGRGLGLIWPVLAVLVAAYAAHEDLGLGGAGTNEFFSSWLNDALLWASAALCLVGALRVRRGRGAWVLAALALASWAIGDTIWSVRFGPSGATPLTSISDVFWLAWYPLILAALVVLVRDRIAAFELDRWIDGVAVMLLVTIPWVAVFLAPVDAHAHVSALADVVDFAYPIGNAVVFGATLGVYALMGWRPGRMWLLLGVGLGAMGIADAIYVVQALDHSGHPLATYDAAWAAGALLIAYASWQPHPGRLRPKRVFGWPAIILPLTAQALAVGVQLYGLFHELPRSERALTLVVLLIAMVQIVVSRPRRTRPPDPTTEQEPVEQIDA